MAGQYLSFRRYPILQEPHPKTLQDREKNKKNPRLDAAAIPNCTPAPRLCLRWHPDPLATVWSDKGRGLSTGGIAALRWQGGGPEPRGGCGNVISHRFGRKTPRHGLEKVEFGITG
jgi:hypothetical protein